MSEPVKLDAEVFSQLDDQQWRRLGVTQTFDRLLIEAVGTAPGPAAAILEAVGRKLTGGAVRFWELSFPQLLRDLKRRGVVTGEDGALGLDAGFADKLTSMQKNLREGVSHVDPHLTDDEVHKLVADREQREAAKKEAQKKVKTPKAPKEKAPKAPKAKGSTVLRKRASEESAEEKKVDTAEVKEAPKASKSTVKAGATVAPKIESVEEKTPLTKLFTSIRLNKLLDCLDNNALMVSQLESRLELHDKDLTRFLNVTNACGVTRATADELYELHFEGRQWALTKDQDRRMKLPELVKTLRNKAKELEKD